MARSICFLVTSYLARAEVCPNLGRLRLRELSRWIVVLTLLGSVFFGISAIGTFLDPETADTTNLRWDNGGTIAGAVCRAMSPRGQAVVSMSCRRVSAAWASPPGTAWAVKKRRERAEAVWRAC